MANINDTLDLVTQRTGSTSGTPLNAAEAAGYRTGIKLDIASIMNQMNSVYYPLFSVLSSTNAANALTLGLAGNVIFTHIGATAADASAYWDSGLARSRTIRETVDVLLTQISDLENQITSTNAVGTYDDSSLTGLINNNTLNLKQLRLDSMGENYGFDNDGVKDLTYPLSQAIDAMGAFFTGYPGTGNTYPASPVYPTLALAVNLSDVALDTTVPLSTITGLNTSLTNIATFVGMSNPTDNAPTYSTHGAIATVTDGHQLERAIQALDAGIAASSGAYSTTASITSNTAGDYTSDDFVHGSPTLDDAAVVAHDNRMLFDKSAGAFRAGSATSTQWDIANRAAYSVAFGLDNTASGIGSFVGAGRENIAAAATSVIAGGGGAGSGNAIGATSTTAFVGAGTSNTIGTVGASASAFIGSGTTNRIGTTGVSTSSVIGGGNDNTVTTAVYAFIGGGATNTVGGAYGVIAGGNTNTVVTGNDNAILGGDSNIITNGNQITLVGGQSNAVSNFSSQGVVVGGSTNSLGITTASNSSAIVGGDTNRIDRSTHSFIGGGQTNAIGLLAAASNHSVLVGGYSNDIDGGSLNVIVGGGSANSTLGNLIDTAVGSFIGGGTDNEIDVTAGSYHVIVGGYSNEIGDGTDTLNYSAIVGGFGNTITDSDYAFIGGGGSSVAGSENTIVGSDNATVAGGFANDIITTSTYSAIGGGDTNTITSATHAVISGGDTNSVTSNFGTVVGGGNNVADSTYGTAMGQEASTDNYGVVAHSAGQIAAVGDAQYMRAIWRLQTTDGTAAQNMKLDGSVENFVLEDDSTYTYKIRVAARRTDANGENAAYTMEGVVHRDAGVASTALDAGVKVILLEDIAGWNFDVLADTTAGALRLHVTGEAAKTINWVAVGEFTKVTG